MAREQDRRRLSMPGTMKTARARQPVAFSDLSESGCRIESIYFTLSAGQKILVQPEGLSPLAATVMWCSGPAAGVKFDQPLHPAVIDRLCQIHPFTIV